MTATSSVGSAGRDYSTLALWVASIPSTLTEPVIAELFNDTEFVDDQIILTGHTTDATNTITVTTGAGQSFLDHADVETNPLRYDVSVGVGLRNEIWYQTCITGNYDNNVHISKLQIRKSTTGSGYYGTVIQMVQTDASSITQCLIEVGGPANKMGVEIVGHNYTTPFNFTNNLIVQTSDNIGLEMQNVNELTICEYNTIVCHDDVTSTKAAININYNSPNIKNCAFFGFASINSGAGTPTFETCMSDVGSPPSGVTQVVYADQFEDITAASADYRPKTGADLIAAGTDDATYPFDIRGYTRSATPTIGAWEFASAAPPDIDPGTDPRQYMTRGLFGPIWFNDASVKQFMLNGVWMNATSVSNIYDIQADYAMAFANLSTVATSSNIPNDRSASVIRRDQAIPASIGGNIRLDENLPWASYASSASSDTLAFERRSDVAYNGSSPFGSSGVFVGDKPLGFAWNTGIRGDQSLAFGREYSAIRDNVMGHSRGALIYRDQTEILQWLYATIKGDVSFPFENRLTVAPEFRIPHSRIGAIQPDFRIPFQVSAQVFRTDFNLPFAKLSGFRNDLSIPFQRLVSSGYDVTIRFDERATAMRDGLISFSTGGAFRSDVTLNISRGANFRADLTIPLSRGTSLRGEEVIAFANLTGISIDESIAFARSSSSNRVLDTAFSLISNINRDTSLPFGTGGAFKSDQSFAFEKRTGLQLDVPLWYSVYGDTVVISGVITIPFGTGGAFVDDLSFAMAMGANIRVDEVIAMGRGAGFVGQIGSWLANSAVIRTDMTIPFKLISSTNSMSGDFNLPFMFGGNIRATQTEPFMDLLSVRSDRPMRLQTMATVLESFRIPLEIYALATIISTDVRIPFALGARTRPHIHLPPGGKRNIDTPPEDRIIVAPRNRLLKD